MIIEVIGMVNVEKIERLIDEIVEEMRNVKILEEFEVF